MLNKAILMGRLVAAPDLRMTGSGISVCRFRIAVNRRYTDKTGQQQADFIDVVAWRQSAEFVSKYFRKGGMIIVEGSIQTRNYEDREGKKRTAVEVVADGVQFGESKKAQGEAQPATPSAASAVSYESGDFSEYTGDSDDLPF